MLSNASFEACPYCGCHVAGGSTTCPHCSRALQRTQGRLPRALVAIMMGLGAGAASTTACSSVVRDEGVGGDGAGGDGTSYTSTTKSSSSTTTSTYAVSTSGVGPSTTPTTTTYSSVMSTYGVGPSCDMEADCTACQTCAFDADCSTEASNCGSEPECLSLNDCLGDCAPDDDACVQACNDANPNGVDPLGALVDCIYCDACFVTCDGAGNGC
jgi:hypothetical protein